MRSFFGILAGFCKGLVFAGLAFLLLAALSLALPQDAIKANIISSKEVIQNFKRADTFTECLVLGAAQLEQAPLPQALFDFQILKGPPCETLSSLQDVGAAQTQNYHRYWNGAVVLARYAFSFFEFIWVYGFYALLTVAAFGLWAYGLIRQGMNRTFATLLGISILWCGGFYFYAGNIAHAPAFFMPLFLLGAATMRKSWWENKNDTVMLAAAMGAMTIAFDMLFGALPFNVLLLLLTAALLTYPFTFSRAALLAGAYGLAALLFYGMKVGAVSFFHGAEGLADIAAQLSFRMGASLPDGKEAHYGALWLSHLPKAAEKIYESATVYGWLGHATLFAFSLAMYKNKALFGPFVLMIAVVPVWYALFLNHSWVHSGFASRLLFWPVLLGFVALALAWGADKMTFNGVKNGRK